MLKPARKIYDWASKKVNAPNAPLWLGAVFLLETVLFLPLDALLMLFCWENPSKRFLFALVATVASCISGMIGFALGYLLWDTIGPYVIGHLVSADYFTRLCNHYNLYENWAVLIGSILPVPFKIVTLSAGFCKLAFAPFVACVFIARALRFFAIAQLMHMWGPQIKAFVDRHFNRIVVAIGAKVAIALTFFWALGH